MGDLISEEEFENCTTRWCEENVLSLAHHFHGLHKTQYERVTRFDMKGVEEFRTIDKIDKIRICLALKKVKKKNRKKEITFCPYLQINEDKGLSFELIPTTERPPLFPKLPGSNRVPEIFKHMVWKNWDQVEMHHIDDLFHCTNKENQEKNTDKECIVRVRSFEITGADIIKAINDKKEIINEIILYPGIDMNKFNTKEMISFTPVLGIKPNLFETSGTNKMGLIESNDDETFIEYSLPCPPTC
ncbi:hypothetical protein AWE51_08535 [Aquimarina aggregata]|uniref:Uncharacterized protein n=1 Tax=Aquimarina aggregata TaxID=1642818 RepID=A0A162ZB88_9FLAO|nr:hypothetical protein [Aquimarina aggregata]KZS39688.1 hypothetical protein AWE51_08535 [Aquimarina aggregata]